MNKQINFIGIGAQKSGTTWVAECMMEHPQILFPGEKELFFFNRQPCFEYKDDKLTNYHKGIKWYINQFPETGDNQIRGEFAANYYNDLDAAEEIKKYFPNVKLLIMLRNPADMLYSLYWYGKAAVRTQMPDSFEKMIDKGMYLDRGLYYKHLRPFYDLFPQKNIHVMLLDDVKNNPKKVVKDLYTFLEVDQEYRPSLLDKKSNPAIESRYPIIKKIAFTILSFLGKLGLRKQARALIINDFIYNIYKKINLTRGKKPPLKQETRNKLVNYYKEDINKLEKLTNKDLSSWKK